MGIIDSYRSVSSSLPSLVRTLVDNSHKTLKNLTQEIVDYDAILDIIIEIREERRNLADIKKDYPEKISILKETLIFYRSKNDRKFLKTEFLDEWKFLIEKLAYPYEYFNCLED